MAKGKNKYKFVCNECGHEEAKWCGRCPSCGSWNSMTEEVALPTKTVTRFASNEKPVALSEVNGLEEQRFSTGVGELDRVLGGGVVPGSLILVGGDPGIGKSTLALQAAAQIATTEGTTLYVTGEESIRQLSYRANRLEAVSPQLFVVAETSLEIAKQYIEKMCPKMVIIDSIQTIFTENITSAPGSVSQVRECTAVLMQLAKGKGIPVMIVGHVTKEGFIAGPRVLEHMVDTVLYFEGERHNTFRILRSVKNRFGSTNEIGVFEMNNKGLGEVTNPSELFLAERPTGVSGSVVVAAMEGTRPLLVEIQALVTPTSFGNPRRMTSGIDSNRLNLISAVLDKRLGLHLNSHDAYVNVAGGVRLDEPAIDLALAVSLASSFKEMPVDFSTVILGEIGLTGEVRGVSQITKRVIEGVKLGFQKFIIPTANANQCRDLKKGIKIYSVETVQEALDIALGVGV